MENLNSEIEELVLRYLANNASPEQIAALEKWVEESKENLATFQNLKRVWEISEYTAIYNSISNEHALSLTLQKIKSKEKTRSLWLKIQKVAAVIAVPLLISTGILLYKLAEINRIQQLGQKTFNEVKACIGGSVRANLPDGSIVHLNSGSSLLYPSQFTSSIRKVYLKGEGFFIVQSDKKHPFIVQSKKIEVKATGTQFNVSAYENDDNITVTLTEGVVHLSNAGKSIAKLTPNQQAIFSTNNNKMQISNVDAYNYSSWKDGKLIFRNETLENIAKRLERTFGVNINITDQKIKEYRFRATFENESLEEILNMLKLTSPIQYSYSKRKLPLSEISNKRTIFISAE